MKNSNHHSYKHPSTPRLLILTATITPPKAAVELARKDHRQRLEDYARGLDFYLPFLSQRLFEGIIFVDNSNSDISSLQTLAHQEGLEERVEWITFNGLDYPPSYGRGYGEFKLIDHAMKHSQMIRDAAPETIIWKMTGRYLVKNFAALLNSQPPRLDLYCHCRNIPQKWMELYTMAWSFRGYEGIIKDLYLELRQDVKGCPPEVASRDIIDPINSGELKIIRRFRVVPELTGYRGYDNQKWEEQPYHILKQQLRQIANTLIPWLWI